MANTQKTAASSKPAEPVKAEANGQSTITISWRDLLFTINSDSDDWDVDILEAFEDGQPVTAVRGLLGQQQWDQFKAARPKPTTRDLEALTNTIASKLGFDSTGE